MNLTRLFEIVYNDTYEKAQRFAWFAHHGTRRKGRKKDPYYNHVEGVAKFLEGFGVEDQDMLAAAFLHDTLEDVKGLKADTLYEMFGERVTEFVIELTNDENYDGYKDQENEDGTITSKKELYMNDKLLNMAEDTLTIKLGDMIYNALDEPTMDQLERMHNNLKFLLKNRKNMSETNEEIIRYFMMAYRAKKRS